MKKKLICGVLIGSLAFSSAILTGCGNSNEVSNNTQTNQDQATSNKANSDDSALDSNNTNKSASSSAKIDDSKTDNSDKNNSKEVSKDNSKNQSSNSSKKEVENSKDINKNNTNSTESQKTPSASDDSKNSVEKDTSSNNKSKDTSNSNKSDTSDNSAKKENNSLTMQQLANKIANFEYDGNVNYITPVKPLGSGKDLTYEEDSSSNIFFCSDDKFDSKNLKYGTLVNIFGYNKESDSYSFRVTNYEALKNGGTGTIDYGTITSQGKIDSANAN